MVCKSKPISKLIGNKKVNFIGQDEQGLFLKLLFKLTYFKDVFKATFKATLKLLLLNQKLVLVYLAKVVHTGA